MSSTSIEPSSTTSDDPFFTDNPAATTTSGGGGGGGFASQSTPLYLFTFLATLFVLLFVSCAIVMRSFFLRRRMRQRIDEAIAAGVLLPPQTGPGSRRRDFGEKPKLWDASLSTPSDEDWESTTPVSVKLITSDSSSIPTSPSPPESSILRRLNPFAHLKSWRRPRSDAPSSPPDPTTLPLSQSHPGLDESIAHASDVEVSLFVAMPNPNKPTYDPYREHDSDFGSRKGKQRSSMSSDSYWDEHEEGVPDVVLGVCHVPMKGGSDGLRQ